VIELSIRVGLAGEQEADILTRESAAKTTRYTSAM
jgi:hypothetical protein